MKSDFDWFYFSCVLKLEDVMEKETYKNAKLILERFDPESKKRVSVDILHVSGFGLFIHKSLLI